MSSIGACSSAKSFLIFSLSLVGQASDLRVGTLSMGAGRILLSRLGRREKVIVNLPSLSVTVFLPIVMILFLFITVFRFFLL